MIRSLTIQLCLLLAIACRLYAQDVKSMYFLNEWSQRYKMNPSFAPATGHFSLPLLGGVGLAIHGNTGLANYIYKYNNERVTFMHSSVNAASFINGLNNDNYLNQTSNINLLSFGIRTRTGNYWSFGCNFRENLYINLPVEFFRLLKLGFQHQTNSYDLKRLTLSGQSYIEFSGGYSTDLSEKTRIGATIKILGGLQSQKMTYSRFDVNLNDTKYEAIQSGESYIMTKNIHVSTDANNQYDISDYSLNIFGKGIAGLGAAADIGITHKINRRLTISAALTDIGYLKWNSTAIAHGIANKTVTFSGFSNLKMDSLNIDKQFSQMAEDLKKLLLFEQQKNEKSIIERIPANLNLALEYILTEKEERNMRIGLLWNTYHSPAYHSNELLAAFTVHPASWFSASATCSLIRKESNRLGLALNYSPQLINIFIASDFITTRLNNQLIPIKKFNINIQAGISLYLGD